jgi:uncharacterized protein (TIGR02453 family)
MAWFTKEYIDYFTKLSRNNKREWFHAHKKDYERQVKGPFTDLVAEMLDRISVLDPNIDIEPKQAMFRIARDIRFSKDKTPYKTHMAAVISPEGRKELQYPGLYLSFGLDGIMIAGGLYKPDKDDVVKVRRAIKKDGASLDRALRGKAFKDLFGELQGEKNKRLPKEFADDVERYPLIANKQFYYHANYADTKLLLRDDLPAFVLKHYRAGQKVNDFLKAAIGRRR